MRMYGVTRGDVVDDKNSLKRKKYILMSQSYLEHFAKAARMDTHAKKGHGLRLNTTHILYLLKSSLPQCQPITHTHTHTYSTSAPSRSLKKAKPPISPVFQREREHHAAGLQQ